MYVFNVFIIFKLNNYKFRLIKLKNCDKKYMINNSFSTIIKYLDENKKYALHSKLFIYNHIHYTYNLLFLNNLGIYYVVNKINNCIRGTAK